MSECAKCRKRCVLIGPPPCMEDYKKLKRECETLRSEVKRLTPTDLERVAAELEFEL